MAAVAPTPPQAPPTVTVTINGVELEAPKGELVVESAKRLGIEIPIFCYHPRMKPVGMCRMCLVEAGSKGPDGTVRMMPKPQAACTLPCTEGLIVNTDTESIHADRRGVLEMLLVNHPLDCPVCDRGGECPLQNNTLFYGPSTSRFVELKRHAPKAFPLSEHVTLDLERCIQCGRCVRFTEEVSGDGRLAFRFRGAAMQPSTFELTDFDSKFSGNTIEICPVGALTSTNYRFRARPWDLETKATVCTRCSNGCAIWMDYRVGQVVRINGRTHEAVNEEWTCDRGKFGHGFYDAADRLDAVLARQGDRLVPASWPDAYAAIRAAFAGAVGALAGPENSNEDLWTLKRLFADGFGSANLDSRMTRDLAARPSPRIATSIAGLETERAVLVFGTSLADELPIVYLRLRKAWQRRGTVVIAATSEPTEVDGFAAHVLRFPAGGEAAAARALAGSGDGGIDPARLAAARALLADACVVTSESIYNAPDGSAAVAALGEVGRLSVFALGANDQGAEALGFRPGPGGMDTRRMLEACVSGELRALWLAGVDPIAAFPDAELARRALEAVPFLVYQGRSRAEAMHYASVVLPQTAPAEADGTYTSCEGRVQRVAPVLLAKGQAKPGWRAAGELGARIGAFAPPFSAAEVMDEIASAAPAFAGARYAGLAPAGHQLLDAALPRWPEPGLGG